MSVLADVQGGQQWFVVGLGIAVVTVIAALILAAVFQAAGRADRQR